MLNRSGTLGRSGQPKEFQPHSGMVSLPPSAVAPSLKSLKDPFHLRIQAQPSPCSQPDNYNSQHYEKKPTHQLLYEALASHQRSAPTPSRPISDTQYYTLHLCQWLESPASKTATVFDMTMMTNSGAEQIRKIGGLPLRSGPREKLKVSKCRSSNTCEK